MKAILQRDFEGIAARITQALFPCVWAGQQHPPDRIQRAVLSCLAGEPDGCADRVVSVMDGSSKARLEGLLFAGEEVQMALDMKLIEDLMRRQFPAVTRDQDGDLVATLESSGGYDVVMWALPAGRTGGVLDCIAESSKHHVPRSHWPDAVWVCNEWNQNHFFPRVSLLIPDFASSVRGPIQCRTTMEFVYGQWNDEFLEAQLSIAGGYSVEFYDWIDKYPEFNCLYDLDENQEREHVGRLLAEGKTVGSTSFAEEFFAHEGFPRVGEPEGLRRVEPTSR